MSDTHQLPSPLVDVIEISVNRYLGMDPQALERMARLSGKIIAVHLRGLGTTLYLAPHLSGVKVMQSCDRAPDTVLTGSPGAFLRLGTSSNPVAVLFSGDVEMTGDVELGQQFKKILDAMEVDWEEQLSTVVGDVLAHQAGNFSRQTRHWLTESADTLGRDIAEYLQEELRLLPRDFELNDFLAGVDTLRSDTDRLEQRVERLLRRLQEDST